MPLAPGESPEHEHLLVRLARSLAQLPREERLIVTLRYWQGLPLQDIAAMLRLFVEDHPATAVER